MQQGLLLAVAASALWGLSPVMIDVAMRDMDSLTVNAWRNLGGVLSVLPFGLAQGALAATPRELALIAASGFISQGLGLVTYAESIKRAGPGRAVPVSFTYILLAQVLGALLYDEPLRWGTAVGAALAVTGVWAVASSPSDRKDPWGIPSALAAAVCWAVGDAFARAVLYDVSAMTLTLWRLLMLTPAFFLASAVAGGGPRTSLLALAMAVGSGVVGLGLALVMYYRAMSTLGLALVTIPTALSPILTQVTSKLALSERLGPREFVGALMVAAGIVASAA